MWWKCPNCGEMVDFYGQMGYVFSDGFSDFDPKSGLWLHTIECTCGTTWPISIGGMSLEEINYSSSPPPGEEVIYERLCCL